MTLEELEKMTVVKLREEAMKFPDVKGVSAMKKEQLIDLLCEKLGVEKRKRPVAAPPVKQDIKKKIRELRALKHEAMEKKDYETAFLLRKKIRTQKKKLRKLLKSAAGTA